MPANPLTLFGRVINRLLGFFGLRLTRVIRLRDLDPATRSIARGLSTSEHNSRENMDNFYSDSELLKTYFTPNRLGFYSDVTKRIANLQLHPSSVLDVGSGSGHLLAGIKDLYPNATMLGVDFSEASVTLAKRLQPGITFQPCSIFDLDQLGGTYDLVICTEVLEHLEKADVALSKLVRMCATGGTIVITVPNGRTDTFAGHFNFWTPESFSREFSQWRPKVTVIGAFLFIVIRPSRASFGV
jgi:2-polyprenyl-3-methyl-5-hydroxy-6-metoxy-1,4-benzoquinol methylase